MTGIIITTIDPFPTVHPNSDHHHCPPPRRFCAQLQLTKGKGRSRATRWLEAIRKGRRSGVGRCESLYQRQCKAYRTHVRGLFRILFEPNTSALSAILAISPILTTVLTTTIFFLSSTLFAIILYFVYAPNFSTVLNEDQGMAIHPPERRPSLGRSRSREIKREQEPPLRRRTSRISDSVSNATPVISTA